MRFFEILTSIDNEFYRYDLDVENENNKTFLNCKREELENRVKPLFHLLNEEIQKLRSKQPQFKKTLHLQKRDFFPEYFIFGRLKISHTLLEEKYIPRVLKFPLFSSLYSVNKDDIKFIYQYILRVLQISPLNKIDFVLIDTQSVGKVFNFLRPVLNNEFIYAKKVLTTSKEINEALKEMYEYMEYILQKQLSGYKDYREYNLKNKKSQLPLKVLVINAFPTLFDSNSFFFLEKIAKFGALAGINVLFIVGEYDKTNKNLNILVEKVLTNSLNLTEYMPEYDFKSLKCVVDYDTFPTPLDIKEFLEEINESYKQKSTIKGVIDAFWNEKEFWSKKSDEGISIPIGWNTKEDIINFEFGFDYSEHHTLIGGRSGSGKSNLINVMIQNMAYFYSPKEIELYLLDYKDGVEFNLYKNLNHASLIAVNSNVSYGITVLEHILNIKNERSELFKSVGVKDFKEYRKKGYDLSRIVIIIDEFQTLFSTRQRDKAEKIFAEILRKGRSFGIHLILSTQTLSGIEVNSISQLKSQIGNRIALSMGENESRNFLSNANDLASKIKKPQGVYNNGAGSVENNNIVYIPLADNKNFETLKEKLSKEKNKNLNIVYNGDISIEMPEKFNNNAFEIILGREDNFTQDELKIKFSRFSGANLLISGKDKTIKEKLINIFFKNLEPYHNIYYINSDEDLNINFQTSNIEILQEDLENSFVIIDSIDNLNELHMRGFTPPPANSLLANFIQHLENGYKKGVHFIVFVDNFKKMKPRLSSSNNDINNFELRAGFALNQEVATSLLAQSIGEVIKTIPKNRAVFSDFYNFDVKHFKIYGV